MLCSSRVVIVYEDDKLLLGSNICLDAECLGFVPVIHVPLMMYLIVAACKRDPGAHYSLLSINRNYTLSIPSCFSDVFPYSHQ